MNASELKVKVSYLTVNPSMIVKYILILCELMHLIV